MSTSTATSTASSPTRAAPLHRANIGPFAIHRGGMPPLLHRQRQQPLRLPPSVRTHG